MTEARPGPDIIRAVAILRRGGVIVYPTETVYGIGCDPFNTDACNRIRAIKGRGEDKPFLLIASGHEQVARFTGPLTGASAALARECWPGPLTLIMRVTGEFPSWLVGPSGGAAFRVTPHPVAAALAAEFGAPIVSTSANRTGQPPVTTHDEALTEFGGVADLVLDDPADMRGVPSTIVDLTGNKPVIRREGGIARETIGRILHW